MVIYDLLIDVYLLNYYLLSFIIKILDIIKLFIIY